MRELRGRVAVVTGGASGIGLGLAERFAAEGMRVVVADVEAPALDDAVARLRAGGADAIGVVTDVSEADSVQALADRTLEAFGAAHVLCNNAGVSAGAPFGDLPAEAFDWVLGVNMWGVIHGCRVFLPLLRDQEEAHIVNTSSSVTVTGYLPTGTAYATSKFAVDGFTETLYRELRSQGSAVGVSLLVPGGTNTRIPDAERNLPEGVPSTRDHPARAAMSERLRRGGVGGLMEPADVAAKVVDAIRAGRFHVLTEPDAMIRSVQARIDWMRTGELPPVSPELEPWGDLVLPS